MPTFSDLIANFNNSARWFGNSIFMALNMFMITMFEIWREEKDLQIVYFFFYQ